MSKNIPSGEHMPHHHDEHEHEPVISERWKWATVLGNAAIGACELITGGSSTLSVTSDGLHNVGDTVTYYMQAENVLNPHTPEVRRQRSRKIAHWIIAGSSALIGAKAGIDLAIDRESTPDPVTIYAASASLMLNGFLLQRFRKGMHQKRKRKDGHVSADEHDLSKHFWAVDIPSAGLALAGAALQRYNVDIEQAAAVASGAVGVYAFRPTEANLTHNCLDGHSHGGKGDQLSRSPRHAKKSWREQMSYRPRHESPRQPSRLKRIIGLGAAAMALASGLLTGDTQTRHSDKLQATLTVPEQHTVTIVPEKIPAITDRPQFECQIIQPGDSQWRMAENRLAAAGNVPRPAAINATMHTMARVNEVKFPDPHTIHAGDCLWVPTLEAAREINNTPDHLLPAMQLAAIAPDGIIKARPK